MIVGDVSFIVKMPNLKNRCEFSLICLMAVALAANLNDLTSNQWKGTIRIEAGVEVLNNPKNPLYQTETSAFEPELTIRESESNSAFSFIRISGLLIDKDDTVYVLDSKDSNIKVFNWRGQFLRSIGKKGQGPGELDVPVHMDFYRATEIAVQDAGNRRLTIFGLNGDYQDSVSTSRVSLGNIKIDSAGTIYGIGIALRETKRSYELQKFDSDFNPVMTVDAADIKEMRGISFLTAAPSFTIGKNGLIYYGFPESEYEIKAYDSAGVLVKRIQKAFVPARIPQDEKDAVAKGIKQRLDVYFPDYYPPYYDIEDNDDGRLIVLSRKYFKKRTYDFDIFDLEGRYLETKRFVPNYRASYFKWKKERLYVAEEEESGLSVIRIYRVRWAGPQS